MQSKLKKIKPKNGVAHLFHQLLTFVLPLLVYVFVAMHLAWAALLVVLLSKWRMLAVKPRHWPANIRANAIDILVGVSLLIFMVQSGSQIAQLFWVVVYGAWLLFIKPGSSVFWVSAQALIGQLFSLIALFLWFGGSNTLFLVFAVWGICYLAARHFLASFDEPHTRLYAYFWGYFVACLAWLLCHWLLFYGPIAQPALLANIIGFGLASLYYLQEHDKLSGFYQRNIVFIVTTLVVVLIVFANWGDRAV